jgi:UDPglucose 6-dehydrogenase
VGAAERLRDVSQQVRGTLALVALPDLIQEGNAFLTFTRPDSILLGCEDREVESLLRELLRPFNRRKDVIRVMSLREAEFSKLAISGILATRISYMNDMASLSESLGVDIDVVRVAMGADPRIGESYLYPGCGFGGPGLSRNVLALVDALDNRVSEPGLLEQVLQTNERQKEVLFRKFWQFYRGNVSGKKVALWGAAFKPGTHRVDNGPALKVIEALWAQGVRVAVHDPKALSDLEAWAHGRGDLILCDDLYEAVEDADALMLVTEWKPYWSPDWQRLKRQMREPLILDGRNIYDPGFVKEQGLVYRGIGRV